MIWRILKWIGSFLTGGGLDRVLDTVDRRVGSAVERDRVKGAVVQEHLRNRGDYMRAGGFWLMVLFAVPLAVWHAAVIVYSMLWCAGCAYPQDWTIAALPPPLDEWASLMVLAIFGVVGVDRLRR